MTRRTRHGRLELCRSGSGPGDSHCTLSRSSNFIHKSLISDDVTKKLAGGTSEMLAPLAVFFLIMLIACTLALLMYWAFDTDEAEIATGGFGLADPEIRVHSRKRRSPAVRAALAPPPGDRPTSVVRQHRGTRWLGSKRKHGPLRRSRMSGRSRTEHIRRDLFVARRFGSLDSPDGRQVAPGDGTERRRSDPAI
jgi:hypothetical protein